MDLQRNKTAVLENAFGVGYEKRENEIWSAQFSLPLNDPKNDKVKLLQYVEIEDDETDEYIGLFRVLPKRTRKNENQNTVTYECQHVLGGLIGSTLFKYHQMSNYTTRAVIEWLLEQQHTKHWKLGTVEFTRYFHYSWENENLLSALFSVPRPFDEHYRWTWDTKTYPWTLNLVKTETEPTARIAEGHNLKGLEIEENPMSLWNRVYPLGAGEGVNQLDIRDVNNGVPYVENLSSIQKHGLYELTWPDQRFTDAFSLKATAERMLELWSEPIINLEISAADLSVKTGVEMDRLKEGKVVRLLLDDYPTVDLTILSEKRPDIKADPSEAMLELGNLKRDLGDSAADVERKQQINELYSNGATNIMTYSYQDNADSDVPAVIPFYLDSDVVNINTCELTFRTKSFRAYSQSTKGGGAIVESTSSGGETTRSTTSGGSVSRSTSAGGGSTQTSSSGGGTSTSTASGGGTSRSTAGGGSISTSSSTNTAYGHDVITSMAEGGADRAHYHTIYGDHTAHAHSVSVSSHTHGFETPNHTHGFSTPNHTHSVDVPSHAHDFTVPAHSHDVTIPAHTHSITLPDHTHDVEHKITELTTLPRNIEIKVDGNIVPHSALSANRLDIVQYMQKDNNGKITRGNHTVEIKPDGLARIEADLILRVFIRSQLGGNY